MEDGDGATSDSVSTDRTLLGGQRGRTGVSRPDRPGRFQVSTLRYHPDGLSSKEVAQDRTPNSPVLRPVLKDEDRLGLSSAR